MNRRRGVDDDSSDEEPTPEQKNGNNGPSSAVDTSDIHSSSNGAADRSATNTGNANVDSDNDDDEGEGERASDEDSSEESSDDDEDEIAKVRDGFIVGSDDEDDDSNGDENGDGKKKQRRKRRRRQHESEGIQLDEDDLDLLGLASGSAGNGGAGEEGSARFKRLKRAASSKETRRRGLDAMFDDEDDNEASGSDDDRVDRNRSAGRGGRENEFDDFIEADEFSEDEDEALRRAEEREIGRRRDREARAGSGGGRGSARGLTAVGDLAGVDEEKLSEIYDVFGDGDMYDWALAGEDEETLDSAAHPPGEEDLKLTDVFEPSELAARMLTTEDNQIRSEDIPERFQIFRQRLQYPYDLNDDAEYFEKKQWIGDKLLEIKKVAPEFRELTRQAVNTVVDCISRDNLEVPYIWHHRQDYLVHFSSAAGDAVRTQLLDLDDLWRIFDLDLDFHALIERRRALKKLQTQVDFGKIPESVSATSVAAKLETLEKDVTIGVEYQDLIDYLQFVASAQLRAARRHSRFAGFDRLRESPAMELVQALGVPVDKVAEELLALASAGISSSSLPAREQLVNQRDSALTPSELATEVGRDTSVEEAVSYLAHELSYEPRVRRFFRTEFEREARIDLVVTDDGKRKITSNSPFADLKYSCNWTLEELRLQPALFLRMLRAESQGLLIVRVQYPQYKTSLYKDFERLVAGETASGSSSNEWVTARSKAAKTASRIVVPLVARNIRETLRADCIRALRYELRTAFSNRLNQAPFKPPGYVLGTIPRVLCISAGEGQQTDAVLAALVDEDGHVTEVFKLGDGRSADFSTQLIDAAKKLDKLDVIGVSGFTPAARVLYENVRNVIVNTAQLMTGPDDAPQPVPVVWVQDEVARLYRHSERAAIEFPDLVPNARYCVALARYLQNPLLEYAQLDAGQLRNLVLHPHQSLLPDDEFAWATETSFVDTVCMEGVDLNQAVRSSYHAAALSYVGGLGPRKASGIVQSVLGRTKGGRVLTRTQLVMSEITPRIIFMNCASFFRIPWDGSSVSLSDGKELEILDSTRIHPEDYELARKMCADALELDEEDLEPMEENLPGGVVGKLLDEDSEGKKLDELVLEEYAEELEQLFKQRKRVTLEHIRQEIQNTYGELREPFHTLTADEVFTILTGETKESYAVGHVVSGTVRRVTGRQLVLTLSGGIDGVAETGNISDDRSVPLVRQFASGQALQAELVSVDYARLFATVDTRQSAVTDALRREEQRIEAARRDNQAHWNVEAERRDHDVAHRRAEQRQRQLRVIKHPLFRPFSAKEAEAFLAPLQPGDIVIRPSSRGMDHLVVTWKVADQIYQHIDVLELDKPNDYAVGRVLQVGPYKYSDLDELIIMHVQSMTRKVDEMTASEKFQKGNRRDVEKWLSAYTNARPTQSVYAFCFDHRRPGYFLLCYMLGANQPIKELHVRVLPNGYELLGNAYTDVHTLANGFKMMVQRSRI